jgi:hypothetical protein
MTVELSNLHDTVPNCFFKRNISNCKLSRVKKGYFCRWLSFSYIYKKEEDIQVLFWGSFMVAGMISN